MTTRIYLASFVEAAMHTSPTTLVFPRIHSRAQETAFVYTRIHSHSYDSADIDNGRHSSP